MALSELLQWISLGLKTGMLQVCGPSVEKRVYFQNGRVASSFSTDPREYLGHFLVSHGYITEQELKMAMEVQEQSSVLLGKILVMINAISEADLVLLLRRKAEESLYDLFLWDEGDFEFHDDVQLEQKMVPLSLDITGIIMEGLRRADEWRRIRQAISSSDEIPHLNGAAPSEATEQDRLILTHIDGERSIAEIALQTHSPEFAVARLVFRGLQEGHVTLSGRRAPAGSPEALAQDVDKLLRQGQAAERRSPETAWKIYKAAAALDPSDGRPRDALRRAEDLLRSRLSSQGISLERVPVLAMSESDLTRRNLSPHEGFVISRVNGSWDIKAIAKISPIPEVEVLLIFSRLLDQGIVRLENRA